MSVSNVNIPTAQSFILVDTRMAPNKVLFLPTASTIQGRYISIKDYYGGATNSSLTISTTGLDRIDQRGIRCVLASSFGSVMLLSDGLRSWNMLGLYEGGDTATAMASTPAVQPTAFTSFRWTITVGNTDTYIQISEFQVGYNNTQVVFSSPTVTTTGTPNQWYSAEPAPAAVDNNTGSKALALAVPALFTVTVASPITVNMYRWATANDTTPGRNPTQWTVDGSTDNVNFIRLHTQNTTYSGPTSTFTFTPWISFTYS